MEQVKEVPESFPNLGREGESSHVRATYGEAFIIVWNGDELPVPYALTDKGRAHRVVDLDNQCLWAPDFEQPFPLSDTAEVYE